MIRQLACALAACLLLAGCQKEPASDSGENAPLLFEVTSASGEVEGWLFGTIHSLPDDVVWRTTKLDRAIVEADKLIVEIANLDDKAALFEIYRQLAMTPGQPNIGMRVPHSSRPALLKLIDEAGYSPRDFHAMETWAVALNLAQTLEVGDSDNGADIILIREFAGRQVTELEGAERQLATFDNLPEKEQSDLLVAVIEETQSRGKDPAKLQRAWLAGDIAMLEAATREGMMADPELREALLIERNRDWDRQLADILVKEPRPLVAVGAGHLVGEDGLPAMLEQRGYEVRRIQ